jgi:hypothetical protein
VPNEAGVVIPCRQAPNSKRTITEFTRGELILDWAPHSDVVAVSTQPRLVEDNSNQFLLLKHAHYCTRKYMRGSTSNENPRRIGRDLSFVFAEDELFGLILRINRPMVCIQPDMHPYIPLAH